MLINIFSLPIWAQLCLIGMIAIELILMIAAIIVLIKTPADRLTLPLWAWLVIIVFVNFLGAIFFLFFGRKPRPLPEQEILHNDRVASAITELYGDKK